MEGSIWGCLRDYHARLWHLYHELLLRIDFLDVLAKAWLLISIKNARLRLALDRVKWWTIPDEGGTLKDLGLLHAPYLGQLSILEPHNSYWLQIHLLNGKLWDQLVLNWQILGSLPL